MYVIIYLVLGYLATRFFLWWLPRKPGVNWDYGVKYPGAPGLIALTILWPGNLFAILLYEIFLLFTGQYGKNNNFNIGKMIQRAFGIKQSNI